MPTNQTTFSPPPQLQEALTVCGFRAEYEPTYLLDPNGQRIQVRDDDHVAPNAQVERYLAQMRGGAIFPPIVVTRDRYKIDGSTRSVAALKNGRHDYPAWVVQIDFDTATPDERNRLQILGGMLNQQNGLPLTREEIRAKVDAALALTPPWTNEVIARYLGMSPKTVSAVRRELAARDRFASLSIDLDGTPPTTLRILGDYVRLHDEPYRRLVGLTRAAGLNVAEVRSLGTAVANAPSDADALAVIGALENSVEMRERIAQMLTAGRSIIAPAHRMRMILGQLLRSEWVQTPALLVEHSPDKQADYVTQLQAAVGLLSAVVGHQEAIS